jgi:uncharacterized repeat protein (TIGR03943 family)
MSRDTENALLLLVGLSTACIAITDAYTRYVKPSLLPWLVAAAALIIALAIVAIVRDQRRRSTRLHDGHSHRSVIVWLLVVPVVVLTIITPPAIRPRAAVTTVAEVPTDILRRPYPPLPAEAAPELLLPEVVTRVAYDSAGTLDSRLITVTGFTMKQGDAIYLARVVILCCAADARLSQLRLGGPAKAQAAVHPDNTWMRVEGKVPSGQGDSSRRSIPVLEISRVALIEPPANPYAY